MLWKSAIIRKKYDLNSNGTPFTTFCYILCTFKILILFSSVLRFFCFTDSIFEWIKAIVKGTSLILFVSQHVISPPPTKKYRAVALTVLVLVVDAGCGAAATGAVDHPEEPHRDVRFILYRLCHHPTYGPESRQKQRQSDVLKHQANLGPLGSTAAISHAWLSLVVVFL